MRLVGSDGTVEAGSGGVLLTIDDLGLLPSEFIAITLKSYVSPFVNPVTTAVVDVLTPSLKVANESLPVLNFTV